jgi:hypothetical protein
LDLNDGKMGLIFSFFFVEVRGFQADLIILEEAAWMDQRIYINTVLPVTGNKGVGTLAITTPGDDLNWFSFLSDLIDPLTGKLIFKTYFVGGACTACQAAGKPEDCTHKEMPPWKDPAVMQRMKAIMNVESFNREIGGIITIDAKLIYAHFVPSFRTLKRHVWSVPPDLIFVAVDPAGGGSQSHYEITSIALDQGRWVVSLNVHSPQWGFWFQTCK